tara:strand:+ start:133 stop:870 length:738 start_codon:yes stop_codon:yes gene_type:complete
MKNARLNKYFIYSILSIILFGFACTNESEKNLEINKLEYLGYEYLDQKVKVFFQNYSNENYSVTLNSLAPQEEISSKGLTELIFINNGNNNSSLKIKNNINIEESVISKSLLNPKLNYKIISINKDFKLKINETAFEESTNTILRLIDVSEDSRCPDPLDNNETLSNPGSCIHNPKTLLHVIIETPRNITFDEFIYKEQLSDYEFFYGGNYIKISKIEPDIQELNRLIPDSDYEITFTITSMKEN